MPESWYYKNFSIDPILCNKDYLELDQFYQNFEKYIYNGWICDNPFSERTYQNIYERHKYLIKEEAVNINNKNKYIYEFIHEIILDECESTNPDKSEISLLFIGILYKSNWEYLDKVDLDGWADAYKIDSTLLPYQKALEIMVKQTNIFTKMRKENMLITTNAGWVYPSCLDITLPLKARRQPLKPKKGKILHQSPPESQQQYYYIEKCRTDSCNRPASNGYGRCVYHGDKVRFQGF